MEEAAERVIPTCGKEGRVRLGWIRVEEESIRTLGIVQVQTIGHPLQLFDACMMAGSSR
jgi:hypothetical protein